VLDLCLECRACKAECPVGVDVGRFKSEFLAGYWKRHGLPLSARAIGNISTMLRLGSVMPEVVNLMAGSGLGRRAGELAFGIDRRRRLPSLAKRTFERQFASQRPTASNQQPVASGRVSVLLFNDTFTNYCHPDIGLAAADVLERGGLEVRLAPRACCGRPLISKGLLDDARALAATTVDALFEYATTGGPIVFLEPSCLSAIREDLPALLRGAAQQRARTVAGVSVLFEEYVDREWRSLNLSLRNGPSSIALHGHCHQKAMGLLPAARALVSRIPAATVTDLDAGCCGMAGSFGYTREHYEVSQQIAERRLLPAARAMKDDAVLVASGTSCREQVAHFTGRQAVHPAQLLQSLVVQPGETR